MTDLEFYREFIKRLGDDPDRVGLRDTPARMVDAYAFLSSGYAADIEQEMNGAIFKEDYDEMVVVKNIDFYSLCEHHLLPFFGKIHVAYLPKGRVIGLSKIPRIVDVFSRRLQLQERMTMQIARCLHDYLKPMGVGVVCEATHLCMAMRGVQKVSSHTTTSAMEGRFKSDARTRQEFLHLIGMPDLRA
ncbi:GTP cyclohydrolase I FolE [bacterium]|nr:GTP cyclohydrolase I FolE [bacterium]